MIKQLTDYIKQEGREFFVMVGVSILLSIISFAYIYYLGTKLTAARNDFNHAQLSYELTDYTDAKIFAKKSLDEWKTDEAQQLLDLASAKSTN